MCVCVCVCACVCVWYQCELAQVDGFVQGAARVPPPSGIITTTARCRTNTSWNCSVNARLWEWLTQSEVLTESESENENESFVSDKTIAGCNLAFLLFHAGVERLTTLPSLYF